MNREVEGATPSPRARPDRLFVVARRDLAVGLRTAQVCHAVASWVLEHGVPPDNLVVLAVDDLAALERVAGRVPGRRVFFCEPDLGDELTAVAAGPEAWRALSSLPLLR